VRLSPEELRKLMKQRAVGTPTPPPTTPTQKEKAPAKEKPRPVPTIPLAKPPIAKVKIEEIKKGKEKELAKLDEQEERRLPPHRPGAVAGREERQRKRGRRAMERRRAQKEIQEITERLEEEQEVEPVPRAPTIRKRMQTTTAAPKPVTVRPTHVRLEPPVTVRDLSQATGIRAADLLRKLLELNVMANINTTLDDETAVMLGMEFGVEVELEQPEVELDESAVLEQEPDRPEDLRPRPPVVTMLGHVDHGKTSLLDAIRKTNVAAHEAGGITQHIGAYQVQVDGKPITFLDTPGHKAFTEMRARGAQVTDIVVLVVAADDGVMPQTEEAISHAKAANVPIIVAINKIDLPAANVDRVMQQLASHGLIPAAWGGDIEVVQTSAVTGQGINELLETIIIVAELRELKANPNRPAAGTCLEASLQGERGVVATLLVQAGTLRRGDLVLCGIAYGRVRAMFDDKGRSVEAAGPSMPVSVVGFDCPPDAGDRFAVVDDLDKARLIAERRREQLRMKELERAPARTLENLLERMQSQKVKELPLIIRADVRGSLEAIAKELETLKHEEVAVKVLHSAVGGITEGDVVLADACDAIIIGFNVVPDERARALAEQKGVQIRRYDVIYQLTDDLRKSLEGLLEPEVREVELGRALVQEVFRISKVGNVAGCRVLKGIIDRNAFIRVIRDGRVIYPEPGSGKHATIQSLKRFKDDVREVREGYECGIKIAGFDDVKVGDVLEVYKQEKKRRTL